MANVDSRDTITTDLQSTSKLVIDAVVGITDIVEDMHRTIASLAPPIGAAKTGRTGGITGFVYRSVRGVTQAVGAALDAGLGQLAPLLDRAVLPPVGRDAALSALNGVLGDYLKASASPLAIPMQWRRGGSGIEGAAIFSSDIAPYGAVSTSAGSKSADSAREGSPRGEKGQRKLLVLIHGLCMNDRQWLREGHDHGAALAAELGYTPIYVRYNSGLSVASNGQQLADMLETLFEGSKAAPIDITLLGHSMGGLLARSALQHGQASAQRWVTQCSALVCLGTPHLGAPLERAGHTLDRLLGVSPYSAPFARLGMRRSAGIQDLRHGHITSGAALNAELIAPDGIKMYLVAGSKQAADKTASKRAPSDGLVPVNSALGRHADPTHSLQVPDARCAVVYGHDHFDLLSSAEVYAHLKRWLKPRRPTAKA